MRDVEQLLRDTLEARAAQVEPRPDVESVLERAARRRSSRTWTAGLVLTAMLLAVVVIPVLLLDRDQQVILEPPESAEPTAPSQSVPSEAAVDVLPVDGSYVYANGVAITGDEAIAVGDYTVEDGSGLPPTAGAVWSRRPGQEWAVSQILGGEADTQTTLNAATARGDELIVAGWTSRSGGAFEPAAWVRGADGWTVEELPGGRPPPSARCRRRHPRGDGERQRHGSCLVA